MLSFISLSILFIFSVTNFLTCSAFAGSILSFIKDFSVVLSPLFQATRIIKIKTRDINSAKKTIFFILTLHFFSYSIYLK